MPDPLNKVTAWAASHKPEAAAGALAGLAGAVVVVKRRKAASGDPGASPFALPAVGGGTVGATPFDSSPNDVYNAVQPILEGLQNQVDRLSTVAPPTQAVPVTPPPATPPPAASSPTGAVPVGAAPVGSAPPSPNVSADDGTYSHLSSFNGLPPGTALFTRNPNGSYTHLSPAQLAAMKPGTAVYVHGNDSRS